jgi:GT2 family glycosyltransferase
VCSEGSRGRMLLRSHEGDAATPDVSIVIASWNAKRHLLECLRSVEADEGGVGSETIVVDNASSDGSPEAVEQEFSTARLIRNADNLGFARASNIGIERASGRYVCLMNSDVLVRPGALRALVAFMDSRPTVGLVGPRVLDPDGSLQPSCRKFPGFANSLSRVLAVDRLLPTSSWLSGEIMTYWSHDAERSVDAVSGCFCLARREAVREVGLLDERFFFSGEDVDWCIRFHAAGWDVRFCPKAEVVHVQAASSSTAPQRFAVEQQRARLQLYRKHYSRTAVAYFMTLTFIHHVLRVAPRLLLYAIRPCRRGSLKARIGEHLACLRWMVHG